MADENNNIEQKISLTYDTNAETTAKEVDQLNNSIEKVDKSQSKSTKTTTESAKAHDTAKKSAKGQAEALESLGGPISGAISGMKAMLKQMWLLIANPLVLTIAAIVGGLALLFKAFTSTNDGADKLEQTMSGVSAVIDILRDRVLKVGEALVKFFSGDFSGAMDSARESVAGFGDEVASEFKKAANAAKELQEVEDATRDLGVARAKLNRDLSEAKEIITDETASYRDKKKAIDEVREAETKQTELELANAKRKLKSIKDLNALSDTSDEDLQKQADAEAALYNLQQESANNRRAINKADKRADAEEVSRLKTISDAKKEALKQSQDAEKAIIEEKLKDSQLSFDKQRQLVKNDNNLSIKDKKDFLKKINDEEKKSYEEHKKSLLDLENKYKNDIENLTAVTDQQKLDLQKSRDLKELEQVAKTEDEKAKLKISLDEKYKILQSQLDEKNSKDKIAKEDSQWLREQELTLKKNEYDKLVLTQKFDAEYLAAEGNAELQKELKRKLNEDLAAIDKEASDKEIEFEEAKKQAKIQLATDTLTSLNNISQTFLGKSKAGIAVQKAIALAQIGIDSASALSNAVPMAIKAGKEAAAVAGPAAPVVGPIATGISYASSAAMIASNILKAKSILSGGSSSGGGGGATGGGAAGSSASPSVGFQTSSENQIATTIASNQQELPPIKAFVVSTEVSTAQAIDRNKVTANSLGGG